MSDIFLLFLIILSSLIIMVVPSSQNKSCISSTKGLVLVQHVYKSFKTSDSLKCYYECTTDISCQSMNYYRKRARCELNNRTLEDRPQHVRVDESAIYLVNPYRIPVGSSREVPAESCEEIIKINGSMNSSVYWMIVSGIPDQVSCDTSGIAIACASYINITDLSRNVKYGNTLNKCDKFLFNSWEWYRLTGAAGIRMPTKCVPTKRCNTHAPGWLSGTHPTMEQGIVTMKVCFHWNNKCCNWYKLIKVRNCGDFFVYQFRPTPHCHLRYCGEDKLIDNS